MGKPVIGAQIGGIPELVRDGETGMTFPSGDAALLASALRDMMEGTDDVVQEMGRNGRSWVESEFTAIAYRQRILDVYQDLGVPLLDRLSSTVAE